ncbi:hypothetical protein P879_00866 [Paragonimus westermani]|uniref:Uncharacterized protein n=1 Tax=Paragonimus westermani TaxID=34504 RepID=A0A8T0DVU6_9TREM|nr:hypothetical protein P879_00866 [Paragonimus westermani]
MIPDWTVSWVGIVLHCCLTASNFTWTVGKVKHNCETTGLRHGFRLDGILKLVETLRSSELELSRCSTKAVQFGIKCELLPYLLLRLLHRAGAFTRDTGGAILCQTDTDGYIAFGHEIVESVLYQVLARDSEATGVHLPLESCVIKLIGELQNYNPVALRKLGGKKTKSTSKSSPLIDEDTIIPGRARVTFKQVGSRFHALVSVSSPRFNLNSALSSHSRNNRLSARVENNLIQCLLDKSDGDAYKHSTTMNSSQCSLLLTEAQSSPVTLRERMLDWINDPDKRAHTRHALLLTTTANLVNYRLGTTHNCAFAFKMVSYQVSKLALFPDPVNLERALLQLDSLVTDPSILTCMANPEFRKQPFTGTVYSAHLLVVYWRFAKTLIHALHSQRSSSPSPAWTWSANGSNLEYSDTLYPGSSGSEKVSAVFSNGEVNGDLDLLGRCALETLKTFRGECIPHIKQPHVTFDRNCWEKCKNVRLLPGPNTTESFVWICGELLYLLGSELDAIRLLSDLAVTFLSFESLTSVDILQLAHLGVGIAIKRRRLPANDNLMAGNIFQLLGAIEAKLNHLSVYPECISYSDFPKEAELMAELNQAKAYIGLFRLEELFPSSISTQQYTMVYNYMKNVLQTIQSIPQQIQTELVSLKWVIQGKMELLLANQTGFEGCMLKALVTMIMDRGIFHPWLAEWLFTLSFSLREPLAEVEPDEASFLEISARHRQSEACLRWALDIMIQSPRMAFHSMNRLSSHICQDTNEAVDVAVHTSLLHRVPRSLMHHLETSVSDKLIGCLKQDDPDLHSIRLLLARIIRPKTADSNALDDRPEKYGLVETLATKIRLQLSDCLLEDGRQSCLNEAANLVAVVIHEKTVLLGAQHPATSQVDKLLGLIETRQNELEQPGRIRTVIDQHIDRQIKEVRLASARSSARTRNSSSRTSGIELSSGWLDNVQSSRTTTDTKQSETSSRNVYNSASEKESNCSGVYSMRSVRSSKQDTNPSCNQPKLLHRMPLTISKLITTDSLFVPLEDHINQDHNHQRRYKFKLLNAKLEEKISRLGSKKRSEHFYANRPTTSSTRT